MHTYIIALFNLYQENVCVSVRARAHHDYRTTEALVNL